jgi:hypothetical protein
MQTNDARDWNVASAFLASDGGTATTAPKAYSVGTTYYSFDFGAGAQTEAGDTDVYVNQLNMTGTNTGRATWTKHFGDAGAQHGNGVAETTATVSGSSIGVVGVIGDYLGGIPGTGLPTNTGTVKLDFLLGLKATDGSVIWSKKVDLNGGGFTGISSNPSIGAYFVCGTFASPTSTTAGAVDLLSSLTNNGGNDIVVAKIDASNGAVLWAKQFGAKGGETCTAITSDDTGANVYITGVYTNDGATATPATNPALAFGTLAAISDAANNQGKIYVAKLSGSDGTPLAASGFGTAGRNLPTSLSADSTGNLYLGGGFLTTVDFGNSVSLTSEGNTDAFIVKFNSSLTAQCGSRWGGGVALQKINALATDSAGHVFAGGFFQGSINIGASGALITSNGNADAFTLTMDASCNLKCGATYGDSSGQEVDAITVARFATTAQNTAMFSGQFGGSINLTPALTTTNSSDVYVAGVTAGVLENGL